MPHRVEFSPAAARQLKKLNDKNRSAAEEIRDQIEALRAEPRPPGTEKLGGYHELFRVRVGDYRIVYAVSDRLVLVLVLKIGNRSEVYERIRKSDLAYVRQFFGRREN